MDGHTDECCYWENMFRCDCGYVRKLYKNTRAAVIVNIRHSDEDIDWHAPNAVFFIPPDFEVNGIQILPSMAADCYGTRMELQISIKRVS